ncbi:MAG: regulatory protein RecX [Candidatus Omnitrophota bacterium]
MKEDKKLRSAMNNAYCLLRARPRSESEMRERLKLKRYDEPTIEAVIADLRKLSQIDDVKFAGFWVESRMHVNPVGDIILRRELKDKGVPDAVIESALQDKAQNYDEYRTALDVAERRFKRLSDADKPKAAKRLYDLLLRRGFEYEIVRKVVSEIIHEG